MSRADRIRRQRAKRYGVETNWAILDLTPRNTVLVDVEGEVRDTGETPSEWIGLDYLLASERAVLRRGLTRGGNDRTRPAS